VDAVRDCAVPEERYVYAAREEAITKAFDLTGAP
jgi:hypothetical protein